jgi:hypothetical protein
MKGPILCPSAPCKPDAFLLGIVLANGKVGLLDGPLKIDDEFVQIANRGRRPEKRFRFASPCLKSCCQQWNDGRCTVIDRCSIETPSRDYPAAHLPDCPIRPQCRWFHQNGPAACGICADVVTDASESWAGCP